MITRRTAGAALLVYAVATFAANSFIAAPGGTYEPTTVARYVSSGHYGIAFAAAYLGCLGALALLPFVLGVRAEIGRLGELAWGLGVAAATTGVIGWFIAGGVDVAMAEGGSAVKAASHEPDRLRPHGDRQPAQLVRPGAVHGRGGHPALPG